MAQGVSRSIYLDADLADALDECKDILPDTVSAICRRAIEEAIKTARNREWNREWERKRKAQGMSV